MSEQEKKEDATDMIQAVEKPEGMPREKEPDFRAMFMPVSKDSKPEMIGELLTGGKNLRTKTRIAHVYRHTIFDMIGPWGAGKYKTLDDVNEDFGVKFRENAISKGEGMSRVEYTNAILGWLIGRWEGITGMFGGDEKKLKEGNKK